MHKYNKENINKLSELFAEIATLKAEIDEEYTKVSANADKRKLEVVRKDGKKQEVNEDLLWFEVKNLGAQCTAGVALKAKYPRIFELTEAHNKKVSEMEAFSIKTFGIDPVKLSMVDIFRIVDGILNARKNPILRLLDVIIDKIKSYGNTK